MTGDGGSPTAGAAASPGEARTGRVRPYAVVLADQPDHLVPASSRSQLAVDLDVLPHGSGWCRLEGAPGPPVGLSVSGAVHHDAWTAWVTHPGHGACLPYLLDEPSVVAVEITAPDCPVLAPVDPLTRWRLMAAGVLTRPGWPQQVATAWDGIVDAANDRLVRTGHAVVPGVLEPLHLGAMRRHGRRLARSVGDGAVGAASASRSRTGIVWDEPVATFFHHQLTGLVTRVVGQPVEPTHGGIALHGPAIDLDAGEPTEAGGPVHADRSHHPDDGYWLRVLVDAWPEPDRQSPWRPEWASPPGERGADLLLGDGVVAEGGAARRPLVSAGDGRYSVFLVLHYEAVSAARGRRA